MATPEAALPAFQRRRFLPRAQAPLAAVVAAAVIAALVLVAIFAPVIAPHDPNAVDLTNALQPPSADHLFGTDSSGRDIFSRLVFGTRTSLFGPLIVVLISTFAGIVLGMLAGYKGGFVDGGLSHTWDVMFAFPPLLLAIVIVAAFGPGFWTTTLAIAIVYIPLLARVVRGVVLVEREKAYVDSCKVQGYSGTRVCVRHILPNVAPAIVAQATLSFGYALLDLAGLAFLGLGVQPPTADWGQMLTTGRDSLILHSYGEVISASIAIAITVVCFNLVGDALARRAGRSR